MKRLLFILLLTVAACAPKDGVYSFKVLATNDVHGRYFDSSYVDDGVRNSLISVSCYVDSVRTSSGRESVILLDVGDFLQGDNAAYYYNYVDTLSTHLYARMAEYMDYDAVIVGNHDIETGHGVYDRIKSQLRMPFLAANALRTDDGKPYFQEYTVLKRMGIKIAVIGFTNPGIPGWLSPELWYGMEYEELLPFAQEVVDRVRRTEHPDVVVVAVHGGTGTADHVVKENPGMALFDSLKGVDLIFCAHDHRPVVYDADSIALVNSGSHCRYLGQGVVNVTVKDGKVVSKNSDASLIEIKSGKTDDAMKSAFLADFQKVKAFTLREVGELKVDLNTVDAYTGMSDYINLIHTLSLGCAPAQISFAAPLTYDGRVPAGKVLYNDLFTIYPYENQLFVIKMTGKEIKDALEYSYDRWINTYDPSNPHILRIRNASDPRTGQVGWSFVARSYNFDSAAGIIYEVDVTRKYGSRINIKSLADGTAFNEDEIYNVALTSYRANGGGGILSEGAGIDTSNIGERVVARYPEIREMLYEFFMRHGQVDRKLISDPDVVGFWSFVPSGIADRMLADDIRLLFGGK